jgi:hypothetical protein
MEQITKAFIAAFESRFRENNKNGIVYDPTSLPFLEKVCQFLEDYESQVEQYCAERDSSETASRIKKAIKYTDNELLQIFAAYIASLSVMVLVMSSVNSGMNLQGEASDIDYGLLVKADVFDKDKYGNLLIHNGYKFKKELYGYFVYTKIVEGIEVEVKLRVYEKSIQIIKLHERLDTLPKKMQNRLAFAKALLFNNHELYNKFKWEIYSAYYVTDNKV